MAVATSGMIKAVEGRVVWGRVAAIEGRADPLSVRDWSELVTWSASSSARCFLGVRVVAPTERRADLPLVRDWSGLVTSGLTSSARCLRGVGVEVGVGVGLCDRSGSGITGRGAANGEVKS
jgi:hypothetical protein